MYIRKQKLRSFQRTFIDMKKYILAAAPILLFTAAAIGQDTTRKKMVEVTSTFKPVLKEAAKINFNTGPPATDTTRPTLQYSIPNQNLLFNYQPGSLQALALSVDTAGTWANSNYIKAGFGSLKTPFLQAGFSLGDGSTAGLNIYAKHVSSQGNRDFQDFSNTKVNLKGYYQTGNNLEWNAGLGMNSFKTYKYGYVPETLTFDDDSLLQKFQTFSGEVSLRNINLTEFGLSYQPKISVDVFSDNHKNSESNTVIDLPLHKKIGEGFSAGLGLTFDLTRFSPNNKTVINNTMYYFSPSVFFKRSAVNIQAGLRPTWDNGQFKLFPNILAEIGSGDDRFTFQAGWTGYVRKTNYQYLANYNPWIWVPTSFNNTWIEERFAGFKGSVGDHLTYNAKVGFNKLKNQPLFFNDTTAAGDGKSFVVVNEPEISVLHFGGELGYNVQEKFSLVTGLTLNQYSKFKEQEKA